MDVSDWLFVLIVTLTFAVKGQLAQGTCRFDLGVSPSACPSNGQLIFQIIKTLRDENLNVQKELDTCEQRQRDTCGDSAEQQRLAELVVSLRQENQQLRGSGAAQESRRVVETRPPVRSTQGGSRSQTATGVQSFRQTSIDRTDRCARDCAFSTQCICPAGYEQPAGKRTCRDINECETRKPCKQNEICFNTVGGFTCESRECDEGYSAQLVGENLLRCNRIQGNRCPSEDRNCINSYSITFFALSNALPNLPYEFYTFNGGGIKGSKPSELELSVTCETCTDSQVPGSERDFSATLSEPNGFGGALRLVRTIVGPQRIDINLRVTLYFSDTRAFTHVHKLKLDIGECTF